MGEREPTSSSHDRGETEWCITTAQLYFRDFESVTRQGMSLGKPSVMFGAEAPQGTLSMVISSLGQEITFVDRLIRSKSDYVVGI
ncbi:hypothetical protein FB466_1011 [Klugiella xanthotipulae]|uniref:Uncharacterized protein n=1 Tax=Klugiella xanthotipulae TaxID=244735 RepID=A0A543I6K8_9MICO|nr:hypothetical protein FB466_1011 [Klugiella xanthotipulae]